MKFKVECQICEVLEIEAGSEEEAERLAFEEICEHCEDFDWSIYTI
jgi:hypothetical protein